MKSSPVSQVYLAYLIGYISCIGNPLIVSNIPAILQEFQLTVIEAGLLISIFALPSIFFIPLSGVISDRIGRRSLLLGCLAISIIGSVTAYFAANYFTLLVGRALQGVSLSPLEAVSNTLITDNFEGKERVGYMAKCSVVQYFAVASVPFIISLLYSAGGWRIAFAFSGLLGLLGLYFCRSVKFSYSSSNGVSVKEYCEHLKILLTSKLLFALFSVRSLAAMIIFGSFYGYYSLYLTEKFGFGSEESPQFFIPYGVGMCVGAYFVTFAYKRGIGQRIFSVLGGGQLVIAALIFLFGTSPWQLFIGIAMIGLGGGIINTTIAGHVSLSTTSDTRGSILSAYSTVFRVFQFIAPLFLGLIYTGYHFAGVYTLQLIFSLLVLLISFFIFPYSYRVWQEQRSL